ncbi:hypothetical protein CDAR_548741 [Caerostris darwini]|uniref:Uncharacterized protein n=1 Tax=Caerostris darwini TaxID=1538125 RepID=A0AAV4WKJ6_9ARAC|nr:hypothetical protein CDAR_548741 [Caerostris darwini]
MSSEQEEQEHWRADFWPVGGIAVLRCISVHLKPSWWGGRRRESLQFRGMSRIFRPSRLGFIQYDVLGGRVHLLSRPRCGPNGS